MEHFPEIVKVLNDSRLIDSESFERRYQAADGGALVSGFYIVSWPEGVAARQYDEHACYIGPFKTYSHARLALDSDSEFPQFMPKR
ncbi:MAG TPA: hypothetical protein VMK05_12260 [Burkholderiales bacterium]|nr:hypothetical protein [Burkholderiales bacterium]